MDVYECNETLPMLLRGSPSLAGVADYLPYRQDSKRLEDYLAAAAECSAMMGQGQI